MMFKNITHKKLLKYNEIYLQISLCVTIIGRVESDEKILQLIHTNFAK
jgi:hypothetical protein